MTFLDYLNLIRRNTLSVLLITLLTIGTTAGLVLYKNRSPFQSTIFVSIGNVQRSLQGNDSSFENVQAADHFSEAVQGWFKNPEFQKRIRIDGSSEISARKQEKQNLLLSYTSENDDLAKKTGEKAREELQKEIETYNANTASEFKTAIYSLNVEEKPLSLPLFLIIGLFGGAILSSFAVYGYEYLFQKISSASQAEILAEKNMTEAIPSMKTGEQKLRFLATHLDRIESKNIQIIGAGVKTDVLGENLEKILKGKTVNNVNFPQESELISENDPHLVVCALGKTTTGDIRKLRSLLSNTFDLLIVEA